MGAAAAGGKGLGDLAATGRAAVQALATMGLSFSAGTSPTVGKPSFELGEDEIELGLGIHGEPGIRRGQIQPADELTETLLTEIIRHGSFGNGKRLALMINNLGATTEMELAIAARHAMPFLESRGFIVERIYAGTFLSSLDMAGISISVLGIDDERLRWLDAPTTAPAWPNALKQRPGHPGTGIAQAISASVNPARIGGAQTQTGRSARRAIEAACNALIDAEAQLTEMDRITGDGDLGVSMKRAAEAVKGTLGSLPLDDLPATLKALGHTLRSEMGGSSGPLYGVLFLRCGNVHEHRSRATPLALWADAIDQGCQAISELGGAKPGDRTMLDALYPFAQSLKGHAGTTPREVLQAAVVAAEHGAEATAQMKPKRFSGSVIILRCWL
jgi:dihydroxyacetone kinase